MHKTDRIMIGLGVVIIVVALVLSFVLAAPKVGTNGGPPPPKPEPERGNMTLSQSGTSGEGSEASYEEEFISPITISITLTWTDEADSGTRFTNAPDQFGLRLEGPNGETQETSLTANTPGGQGTAPAQRHNSSRRWNRTRRPAREAEAFEYWCYEPLRYGAAGPTLPPSS